MEENKTHDDGIETDDSAGGETTEESRRSFMKKGALASGATALGLSSVDSAAAQDGPVQVLVYTYNYYPNVAFDVIQQLQASTTVNVLRRPSGRTVPEISQPDDYNGYVINYRLGGQGGQSAGITTLLFTRDALQTNARYRLSGNAQVFSSDLNLLSTTARQTG
ncbi:hypothetical protein [Halomicrococcus sp. SG-WS-1]|uniref:hypothetical protein n=1 Tax=Halomicrococcus sp. SG-WS-1 TaxID=3439057 RepID=UPI003F79AF93